MSSGSWLFIASLIQQIPGEILPEYFLLDCGQTTKVYLKPSTQCAVTCGIRICADIDSLSVYQFAISIHNQDDRTVLSDNLPSNADATDATMTAPVPAPILINFNIIESARLNI